MTPPSGLARRSVRGFLWTALTWGSNRIVVLVLTLILAHLLTPADFGLVTASLTVIAILDAALDLGVGAAVVAEQEHGISGRTRTAMTVNLGVSALISVVGVLASPLIAALFHASAHSGLFALIFLYPLFRGAAQISDAVLKRDLLFRRRSVVDATRAVGRVAISLPLALTVGGAVSITAGIVGSEFLAMLLLWSLVPIRPAGRLQRSTVSGLLRFGGQVTFIRILGSVRSTVDYIVVGSALGATALGYYGIAYKLPELLIENVLWIFTTIAFPAYARARSVSMDVLNRAMLRATRLLAMYGLAVGTILALLARDAVPVLFSAQWRPAIVPMALISVSLGVMAIAWASGDVFSVMGRPGTLLVLDVPATTLMIAGFLYAARYHLVGIAAVHLIFNVVYFAARMTLLRRVTGTSGATLAAVVLPGVGIAAATAAVGVPLLFLLPAGTLSSLATMGVATCATAVLASMVFARPALTELAGFAGVRPARTPATSGAVAPR